MQILYKTDAMPITNTWVKRSLIMGVTWTAIVLSPYKPRLQQTGHAYNKQWLSAESSYDYCWWCYF